MNFDFDKSVNRRGTNCYKWDEPHIDDIIPMWVADMDFPVAPVIQDAINRRVAHGVFGYTIVPDRYHQAIDGWFVRHHNFHIEKEWMLYTTGVVPALSAVIKAMTQPGDKVILQTPVYNCFFSSVKNNGCEVVENPLIHDNDGWRMDYDDLEKKVSDDAVKLLILCNPHNPVGRVWTAEEMLRLNDICMRHGVTVVADEIHCGIIMEGYKYIPFASLSQETLNNSITCNSASKSFNIAGLQCAYIFSNNESTRKAIDRAININEICDLNPIGIEAQTAAYNEGDEWLQELNKYIGKNYATLKKFFEENMPKVKISSLEGTYLVWADVSALGVGSDELTRQLEEEGHVKVSSGTIYGKTTGEGYIRINIACPQTQLQEALNRMQKVMGRYC